MQLGVLPVPLVFDQCWSIADPFEPVTWTNLGTFHMCHEVYENGGIFIIFIFYLANKPFCLETGRGWKMKTPEFYKKVISFTWCLLDIFEKWQENENFKIFKFTVFTIFFFSSKAWNLPKTLKLCPFDISVGIGAFVIGLGQISSFLSLYSMT